MRFTSIISGSVTVPITSIIFSSITLSASTLFSPNSPLVRCLHWLHRSAPTHPIRSCYTTVFPSPSSPLALSLLPLPPSSPAPSLSASLLSSRPHHLSSIIGGSLLCPHPPISLVHSTLPSAPISIHSITLPLYLYHFCSPSSHSLLALSPHDSELHLQPHHLQQPHQLSLYLSKGKGLER